MKIRKFNESLDDSFKSTKNSSNSLSEIGITVGDDGKLSINEEKLSGAVKSDAKKVKNIFSGSIGIANETYNKVQNAMNNSKNLYPSFQFSSGDSSIYSSNNSLFIIRRCPTHNTNGQSANLVISRSVSLPIPV